MSLRRLNARDTSRVLSYLLLAGVVFGFNLLPAFAPPTWATLVYFRLNSHIPAVPLVLIGALAASCGRLVLALVSRRVGNRLPARYLARLDAARELLAGGRGRQLAGLALFIISPIPSAQLFVAVGLLRTKLAPVFAIFLAGRLVTYSISVGAAGLAKEKFGSLLTQSLTSPGGIAAQIVMLLLIVARVRVDWVAVIRWLGRRGVRTGS